MALLKLVTVSLFTSPVSVNDVGIIVVLPL